MSAADRTPGPDRSQAASGDIFAERLLQVIDEGQRTATYKLALLLALIDATAAHVDQHGGAPTRLHTRTVAAEVLRLYLPHARRYLAGTGEAFVLRQIANGRSAILGAVVGLHTAAEAAGCRSIDEIPQRLPDDYARCLDAVERTVARYPVRLLQVVGREYRPFLYDIDWTESVSLSALHADNGGFLRFRPGAGDHLLRLAPLIRPLVELHWTRMVARLNRIDLEEERLRAHLFGADRLAAPAALRSALIDLHGGACFYCGDRLRSKVELDHFIPWARWPNDAVENLVPADRCNNHKRDFLPALAHVERWRTRLYGDASALGELALSARWPTEPERSLALARSCYAHLPRGTPLWVLDHRFAEEDPASVVAALTERQRGC